MLDAIEPSRPATASSRRSQFVDTLALHAHERPSTLAIVEVGDKGEDARVCTFGQLAAFAADRAEMFSAALGIGEPVLAILPSGIDYIACFVAAIAAGVRFIPMSPQATGAEVLAVAKLAGVKQVVTAVELPSATALADLHCLQLPHDQTLEAGRPLAVLRSHAGAIILSSSGTTGLPKLAVRESGALDVDAGNVIQGMNLCAEDRVLVCTPLSHSYGVDILLATLTAGACLRTVEKFDVGVMAGELLGRATVLPGVPFVFEALGRVAPPRPSSIRLALSAGTSLADRVRREFTRSWGFEIGQLYGATELGTVSMEIPGTEGFDPTSIGRPLAGVSMRIVDCEDSSRQLGPGVEGQLAVFAPSMLASYLNGEVPTADGHLLTGDLARIDGSGRVYITGRKKLLIDVGAYKVNPLEIEAVLARHPDVAECVVVPLVLSDTMQRLRAVYVPTHLERIPSADELRSFLRARLSAHKVPRVIECAASLPKSATGKVRRVQV